MKITCESCGAKYTIADDKVLGRKVKIRCKGCSTPIVVDGQKLGPSGAPPGGGDVKPETIVPSPSTLIPTPASEWSVNFSETDQRTLSTQQILEGYQAGQIPADVYVWRDGMADWVPLLECAELAPLLAGGQALAAPPAEAPPPPGYGAEPAAVAPAAFPAPEPQPAAAPEAAAPEPAPVAAPAAAKSSPQAAMAKTREAPASVTPEPATGSRTSAARVSGGRSAGAHDLFAGVETAGAENLEIPIAAPVLPQAGSTSYNDDRPTGARNENSVLFSLDSMKATNLAPAPKAGARPAADDPFGMGASSGSVANIGGGNALFTLADNQRLLSAPPPPPEAPPKAVAVASAMPSLAPAAMTKKTLGIVIGAVVAVLLLGVGIGVAVGGGDKEKSEGEASSAMAETSAAPEEKKPEEKVEKKEEPAAPPAESATAKAEEKPAEQAKGGAASTTPQPGTKPTPGKPAPKKEEAPPPVVADQPFNRGAAVSAMSAAASQAASCKKPGGPTGSGKATLTFAPTGRVTSATVTTPPFAGTAVGGCVAGVFRRAKVPPFTGNSITVSKSFTIN
jgi:predicted Zn finger-like uncharacterized protein